MYVEIDTKNQSWLSVLVTHNVVKIFGRRIISGSTKIEIPGIV